MHNGAKNTPEALPQIIDAVRTEGYEFVPISQLIPEGDYTTDHTDRMYLEDLVIKLTKRFFNIQVLLFFLPVFL